MNEYESKTGSKVTFRSLLDYFLVRMLICAKITSDAGIYYLLTNLVLFLLVIITRIKKHKILTI